MINDTFDIVKTKLELNETFRQTVSRQHNAVRSAIESTGQSVDDTKLIGSVLRQTRIQPRDGDLFDIDILVVLGSFERWLPIGGITAQNAMDHVYGLVSGSARYGAMAPQQDHPVITFEYANDVKVELVPAYRDNVGASPSGIQHQPAGRGYWIPNSVGGWDFADYDYEAQYITEINRLTSGWFIPTVKMLKAIKREHFPSMKSFHLEVIAALINVAIPRADTRSALDKIGINGTFSEDCSRGLNPPDPGWTTWSLPANGDITLTSVRPSYSVISIVEDAQLLTATKIMVRYRITAIDLKVPGTRLAAKVGDEYETVFARVGGRFQVSDSRLNGGSPFIENGLFREGPDAGRPTPLADRCTVNPSGLLPSSS
jgi:hypothetical protein